MIPTYAWHPTGHFLIARIAQIEIEKQNKELNQKLIDLLQVLQPFTNKEKKYPFVECSSFPDDIKYIKWRAFNKWHFQEDFIYTPDYAGKSIKKTSASILVAINEAISTLLNTNKSMIDDRLGKSFELRYLIHLIGDIHQPLHSVSLASKDKPRGDAGGNGFSIKFKYSPNLHTAWDRALNIYKEVKAPLSFKDFDYIDSNAKDLIKNFPREKLKKRLEVKDRKEWLAEAKNIAQQFAYNGVNKDEEPKESYIAKAKPIIQEQIAIAGYRLANLLLEIFKDKEVLENHQADPKEEINDIEESDEEERSILNQINAGEPQIGDDKEGGKGKGIRKGIKNLRNPKRQVNGKQETKKNKKEVNLKNPFILLQVHSKLLKNKEVMNDLVNKKEGQAKTKIKVLLKSTKIKENYEKPRKSKKKKVDDDYKPDSFIAEDDDEEVFNAKRLPDSEYQSDSQLALINQKNEGVVEHVITLDQQEELTKLMKIWD